MTRRDKILQTIAKLLDESNVSDADSSDDLNIQIDPEFTRQLDKNTGLASFAPSGRWRVTMCYGPKSIELIPKSLPQITLQPKPVSSVGEPV